eukprot:TRINITY_DN4879_c0_g1_i1.p1 TRINITY_DN4879_c0_g1~~TRINITY_DN4879_c0_g1_i1.p1  ORF type:complete len:226 (-),score=68.81 TRINITY_DN4879_c0_g1_i1:84-761(-)
MDVTSALILKGVINVCKYVGLQRCAMVAGASVGRGVMKYTMESVLGQFLPLRIVKCVSASLPYAPAAVMMASSPNGLVAGAGYVVLSQVADYIYVAAIRTVEQQSIKVLKYVFITKPLALLSPSRIGKGAATTDIEGGWVLMKEEDAEILAVENIDFLSVDFEEVDGEKVRDMLRSVEKSVLEVDVNKIEYVEEAFYDERKIPNAANRNKAMNLVKLEDEEFVVL